MNQKNKLTVYFEKKNYSRGLIVASVMILLCTVLVISYSKVNITFPSWPVLNNFTSYILFLIKAFFYFGAAFFSFALLIGLLNLPFMMRYKGPASILDENGIWVKNYNFVPWEDIEKVDLFSFGNAPKCLGIWVKDRETLSDQSNVTGKIAIFFTKIFKTPHISLGNLDKEYDELIVFAHRYWKKSDNK
ncbi:hypothetical protein KAH94_05675 [bacterium]|nr:hypothetical protein [bacterium]